MLLRSMVGWLLWVSIYMVWWTVLMSKAAKKIVECARQWGWGIRGFRWCIEALLIQCIPL